jgi:hypothetical protein
MPKDMKDIVTEVNKEEVIEVGGLVLNHEPTRAHGQTGPKTQRGKWHSKWNALKHGRYAKSTLLPFEDEAAFKS